MKTTTDLTREAQSEEERLNQLRRRIWQGEDVPVSELLDAGMAMADYLCKVSSRIDKERDGSTADWLKATRRSLRSQLREYWGDALESRRDIRARTKELAKVG